MVYIWNLREKNTQSVCSSGLGVNGGFSLGSQDQRLLSESWKGGMGLACDRQFT